MYNDMNERRGGSGTIFLVILVIVIVVGILWATGLVRWENSAKKQKETVVVFVVCADAGVAGVCVLELADLALPDFSWFTS